MEGYFQPGKGHCSSKQVAAKASRALRVSSGRSSLCSLHFSAEDRGFLRGEPIMETQQASQSTIFTNVQRVKPGIIALMPQPWNALDPGRAELH